MTTAKLFHKFKLKKREALIEEPQLVVINSQHLGTDSQPADLDGQPAVLVSTEEPDPKLVPDAETEIKHELRNTGLAVAVLASLMFILHNYGRQFVVCFVMLFCLRLLFNTKRAVAELRQGLLFFYQRFLTNENYIIRALCILLSSWILSLALSYVGYIYYDLLEVRSKFGESLIYFFAGQVLKLTVISACAWLLLRAAGKLTEKMAVSYYIVLSAFYLACASLSGVFSSPSWPGVGDYLYGWLMSSGIDANLCTEKSAPIYCATGSGAVFVFNFSLSLLFFYLLRHQARKCALFFANFNRQDKERGASSLTKCLDNRVLSLHIRSAHPFLESIGKTALLFLASYGILFYLVDFSPGFLGDSLRLWLASSYLSISAVSGNASTLFALHPELLHFLASTFALFGAVPFSVMMLAFLPDKSARTLDIYTWGLFKNSILSWREIRAVNFSRDKKSIEIVGSNSKAICKLDLARFSKSDLGLLVRQLDEQVPDCILDLDVLSLKDDEEKGKKEKSRQRRFTATNFLPHSGGDMVREDIRVVRRLSSKPLSVVYLVRYQGRLHVLKQFSLPSGTDGQLVGGLTNNLLASFQNECAILASLNIDGISKVEESFSLENSHYLLLQHIAGKDLYTAVQESGPFREDALHRIALRVAKLMHQLHENDSRPAILHRDLTPDNLVLTDSGQIALIDFGSAHQFLEGITGTLVGKQAYVAPEQLRGKATIQSDIYSFGACLYYLASGVEPKSLKQSSLSAAAAKDSWLNNLIMRCTEFEAAKRPQDFAEILALLGECR